MQCDLAGKAGINTMSMKCGGSEEAWYILGAFLKGKSQTAVGALTN